MGASTYTQNTGIEKIDNGEILRVLGEGNSISKTAEILGVSMSSVQRAKKII